MNNFIYTHAKDISDKFKSDLVQIVNECISFDEISYNYFFDTESEYADIYKVYYAQCNDKLIGFLSVYVFDENNFEICIFVHPEFRHNKIATHLFENFYTYQKHPFISVSISPDNNAGIKFLESLDFSFSSTELLMNLNKSDFFKCDNLQEYSTKQQIKVSKSEDGQSFILKHQEKTVGKCFINMVGNNTACISDVYINYNFRGKQLGFFFLRNVLNQLFIDAEQVILHVVKENIPAYNLYKKLGFKIIDTSLTYENQ